MQRGQWAGQLTSTRGQLYNRRSPGVPRPKYNASNSVADHTTLLYNILRRFTPHASTNTVIKHIIDWCIWLKGMGFAQSDIENCLSGLPMLFNLQSAVRQGQNPTYNAADEPAVQECILQELHCKIEHHVTALAAHLGSLPTDLSQDGRLAKAYAWTRKRVKFSDGILLISGSIVTSLPFLHLASAPAGYAGAGMAVAGALKTAYQHCVDNPNGSAVAYDAATTSIEVLRASGYRLLTAWMELCAIAQRLLESSMQGGEPLTDDEKQQIEDFFLSFQEHFQPIGELDLATACDIAGDTVSIKHPAIAAGFDERYALPAARAFSDRMLEPGVQTSGGGSSVGSPSSRHEQHRPDSNRSTRHYG